MNARTEILDYINCNETAGALLLTGQWGCGKSYLVKKIAEEANREGKYAIAVISLFGLDSISSVNRRVKEEYLHFRFGKIGKGTKKLYKSMTALAKNGLEVASIASGEKYGLAAASQGLSSVLNYDILEFVEVQNEVGKSGKERKFVIVFDDFERSNLCNQELLGVINEYVENKKIKTIIIADEGKIEDEIYKEYKEKIVSRTVKMPVDYEGIIDGIIENYHNTADGYKIFLENNSSILKQVFKESESNNIRTLKCVITDFERVYSTWKKTKISDTNMKWALYTFAAEMFIAKSPTKEAKPSNNYNDKSYWFDSKETQYPCKGKYKSSFSSFTRWISKGEWNEEFFFEELKNRYGSNEDTALVRLLYCRFWDLDQIDIDEGLPQAVELAYNGQLNGDHLLSLLCKIHMMEENSIDLPCPVDYDKINDGFDKRFDKIKSGEETETTIHVYLEREEVNPKAYQLLEKVRKLENRIISLNHVEQFKRYITDYPDVNSSSIHNIYIEEFDDCLLKFFETAYAPVCNSIKREYAYALLHLVFDCTSYSSEKNIANSIRNFNELILWLENQSPNDYITRWINENFIKNIRELSIMNRTGICFDDE